MQQTDGAGGRGPGGPAPAVGYTIRGGLADAERLDRQGAVMMAASLAFLVDSGVGPGWSCLDVGCGTGQVAVELAGIVGVSGSVVGVDVDAEALRITGRRAAAAGVTIELRRSDAALAQGDGVFDLAWARLVLSHLTEPAAALRAMGAALRPGGVLAVEDLCTGTLRSDPPNGALDALQEIYATTVRRHGGDPTIGPRLPALLRAIGATEVEERVVANPMTTVEQKLFLVELLDNMRDAILGCGAASAEELDRVRAGVDRAARDPATIVHQAEMHQVRGHRPVAGGPVEERRP